MNSGNSTKDLIHQLIENFSRDAQAVLESMEDTEYPSSNKRPFTLEEMEAKLASVTNNNGRTPNVGT